MIKLEAWKLAGLAQCLLVSGCPQLMSDGFAVTSSSSGGTGGSPDTGHSANDSGSEADDDAGLGGTGSPGQGSGGAAATGGTVSASGGCRFTEFAAAEKILGLGVTSEHWSPSLSADSLTVYFSSWDTTEKLYVATRSERGRYFSAATRVTLLGGTLSAPASPFVGHDGLELYYLANGSSAADRDIWMASRELESSSVFSNPRSMTEINSTYAEGTPWLSRDGSTLLFSSASPGTGDVDIWSAARVGANGTFSTPEPLAGINSAARDESPVLSNDGLTLFFSTTRASSTGDADIWYATRARIGDDFGSPAPVTELNTSYDESDLFLSSDETEMLFVTDRSGTAQLWRATRDCE